MRYLKLSGRGFCYVVIALAYVALLLNSSRCFSGYVESSSPRVEALVGLFLLLPWLLLPIANVRLLFKGPHSRKRLWTAILLLPISLWAAFVATVIVSVEFPYIQCRIVTDKEGEGGILHDQPRPLPGAVTVGNHRIRAYESPRFLSGNAVVIQREQPLAFGLSWVNVLHVQYPAQTVKMTVQNDQVRCTFPDSPGNPVVLLPLR